MVAGRYKMFASGSKPEEKASDSKLSSSGVLTQPQPASMGSQESVGKTDSDESFLTGMSVMQQIMHKVGLTRSVISAGPPFS
jgi:hypothetical protein